ncbi:UNVERIFIED_CONTAM: hypothetical protein Slati_1171300 [Sesamum latifolium]|uniref:Retrotransposon gag domain-containing protein n=1 Tax=Sesamum latifolium TaxID=2727402 RepID=A0AAW2XCN3_9LAMI
MGAPAAKQAGIPFTEGVMVDELLVNCRTPAIAEYDGTTDPQEHMYWFENTALLHRYTDDIKCRVIVTTFARAAEQWFNQLPPAVIGSFQEFRSLFLHQFASNRKHQKIELSFFSIHHKEGESLKDYLQRFNTAALEVSSATQEVKASAFAQGLMDRDFFKSLAKKPPTKFDVLLAGRLSTSTWRMSRHPREKNEEKKEKKTKMKVLPKNRRWTSRIRSHCGRR